MLCLVVHVPCRRCSPGHLRGTDLWTRTPTTWTVATTPTLSKMPTTVMSSLRLSKANSLSLSVHTYFIATAAILATPTTLYTACLMSFGTSLSVIGPLRSHLEPFVAHMLVYLKTSLCIATPGVYNQRRHDQPLHDSPSRRPRVNNNISHAQRHTSGSSSPSGRSDTNGSVLRFRPPSSSGWSRGTGPDVEYPVSPSGRTP